MTTGDLYQDFVLQMALELLGKSATATKAMETAWELSTSEDTPKHERTFWANVIGRLYELERVSSADPNYDFDLERMNL
jgi:hypothetical protein